MAASATDIFKKQSNNFSTTTTTLIVGTTDTSVTLSSVSGLPTDTGIVLVIDRVDANGNKTSSKREYVQGIVSGSSVINLVRGVGGSTAQSHSIGAVVEQVFDQSTWNDTVSGILTQHTQTGTHTGITTDTLTSTGNVVIGGTLTVGGSNPIATGWNSLSYTPNTVVYNGNRSYTFTINAVDATGTLSPGMRIQTTRTVTAPTKCTSLNGTTQYYSKSSPAGMTFTNNFVVSAWVKLTAYGSYSDIASRFNGTSGWAMDINIYGQVRLMGLNAGSANISYVQSYQSIPLNKWVHVAAQLDMATFTATPTTSYTMIDGVDVPAQVLRAGTNPTALIQAGNLEIGSNNGGGSPFPGKIAQVAIYSAKVTQANIVATISQGLTGSETSLISAYSFNNSINDLNANANNLTANGSAVATNADTPFTQTNGLTGYTVGTTNFGIVTASSFSTNTTLVVQVPEGDTLPTTGGISAVSYSTQKVPYGMPIQEGKWDLTTFWFGGGLSTGSIAGTWGTFPGISIVAPIGPFKRRSQMPLTSVCTTGTSYQFKTQWDTASPSVNVEGCHLAYTVATNFMLGSHRHIETISNTSATTYSLYGAIISGSGTQTGYLEPSTFSYHTLTLATL
jgi:hypothetical protein